MSAAFVQSVSLDFAPADLLALQEAKRLLENPGLAARMANSLGKPIQFGMALLPGPVRARVGAATSVALKGALRVALGTMGKGGARLKAHPRTHKAVAVLSGSVGGFFGAPALVVELPFSTCVMLRSIADIARSQGEDLSQPEARMACLEVFALGGASPKDDGVDSAYFQVRLACAKAATEAAEYLATQAVVDEAAPALLRFVAVVAARFEVQVTEKMLAAAVPLVGAGLGGFVNLVFTDHFQDMARGHFTVRKLERRYGKAAVQRAYAAA
jgi:hypothetical protein